MAASVPNKFVGTTTQDISSLDANFDALVNFLNSGVDFQGAELVSSYMAIRALTAFTTSTTLAFTTGRLSMGDGGMGWFRADPSDTTSADNDATILVAADGMRWKRLFSGAANVLWFGGSDDAAANALFAFCDVALVDAYIPALERNWVWTTTKKWNWQKYSVEVAGGAIIDATAIVGNMIFVNAPTLDNIANNGAFNTSWSGGLYLGASAVTAIFLGGEGTDTTTGALVTRMFGIKLHAFGVDIQWGNNATQNSFINLVSTVNQGTNLIFPTGLSNSGENISFMASQFLSPTTIYDIAGGEFTFTNCSFDYAGVRMGLVRLGATVRVIGGHSESSRTTPDWYRCQNANSSLTFLAHSFAITNTTKSDPIFTESGSEGIYLRDGCYCTAPNLTDYSRIALGDGKIWAEGWIVNGPQETELRSLNYNLPASSAQNWLADGGFADPALAWFLNDWGFINTPETSYSIDTTVGAPGASSVDSLKLTPPTGGIVTMVTSLPCGPGTRIQLSGALATSGLSAGDNIAITFQFLDASGNQPLAISPPTHTVTQATDTAGAFVIFSNGPSIQAPAGVAKVKITISTAPSVNWAAVYWLDELLLSVNNGNIPATRRMESLFSPTVIGTTTAGVGTYSVNTGRLVLNDNNAQFSLEIAWSAHTGTGDISVAGLPLLSRFGNPSALQITSLSGLVPAGSLQAYIAGGSSTILISAVNTAGTVSNVPLPPVGHLVVSGTYMKGR